jgi:ferredoxin-NADP reductase
MSPDEEPAEYTSRLVERREVAERTVAFHFEKPAGFTFIPGQFGEITLRAPKETDAEGNTRAFSIASAPDEPTVMVTTRLRDTAFKRTLAALPLGSEVTLKGPFGDLVLDQDHSRPAVFLTGGIGITPFRSIVVDAAHRRLPHPIVLFYTNRRPEDAAFLSELQALERENPNFRMVPTMTQMGHSKRTWRGEVGKVDQPMIARHLKEGGSPIYYIAGPPGMVKGLQSVLRSAGVDDSAVRHEEFDGY